MLRDFSWLLNILMDFPFRYLLVVVVLCFALFPFQPLQVAVSLARSHRFLFLSQLNFRHPSLFEPSSNARTHTHTHTHALFFIVVLTLARYLYSHALAKMIHKTRMFSQNRVKGVLEILFYWTHTEKGYAPHN